MLSVLWCVCCCASLRFEPSLSQAPVQVLFSSFPAPLSVPSSDPGEQRTPHTFTPHPAPYVQAFGPETLRQCARRHVNASESHYTDLFETCRDALFLDLDGIDVREPNNKQLSKHLTEFVLRAELADTIQEALSHPKTAEICQSLLELQFPNGTFTAQDQDEVYSMSPLQIEMLSSTIREQNFFVT
jgi:hypothetical protein